MASTETVVIPQDLPPADHNALGGARLFPASAKFVQIDLHAQELGMNRKLDVAIIQHLIVEEYCQPRYNHDQPVKWSFPHSVDEVIDIGRGHETCAGGGKGFAQLAVIVRPPPLHAVKEVSKANQLMPQKSTFFYPKLATGLFINPLG